MRDLEKYKYISILRCSTWCIWPAHSRIISKGMSVPIGSGDNDFINLSVHLVSYTLRPRPENQLSKVSSKDGPLIWHGNMNSGFWAGQLFIKAPEDTVKVEMVHEYPHEGEIDIQLHIETTENHSIDKFKDIVENISYSVLTYLNVSAGELLIPVAPIQIRKLEDSKSEFNNLVKIFIKERKTFSGEFLRDAIEKFIITRHRMPSEDIASLDAAMRRYLDSITETSEVDKYCDLWEACEFATIGLNAKGGKVGKLAQALSNHMVKTNPIFTKRTLENKLKIAELYKTRGAIVHNAIQNPQRLQERTKLLSEIALEIIRFRLDVPYEKNRVIEEEYHKA